MADSLLHITLARQIRRHPNISPPLRSLLTQNPDDYAMGSILFDLPFYNQLLLAGLETLAHKPITYHPFGQTIHHVNGATLCISLLHHAATDAQTALALGALTHFAVDIVFHREIESRIINGVQNHDTLEREMGLHCHYDILGHSGVGTPYTREITFLFPAPTWESFVVTALSKPIETTPPKSTFTKWQRSFRAFGYLYSKPYFPWLKTLAPDNPELARRSLELMEESIEIAVSFMESAFQFVQHHITINELIARLPSKRMSDGAFA